jgi:RNA methyltransferase, TrmH family
VSVADGDDAGSLRVGFKRKPAVSSTKYDWRGPRALVVGSEAVGASAEAHALASARVSIPMANVMESLNAAVAGAVVLFEASRYRTTNLWVQAVPRFATLFTA